MATREQIISGIELLIQESQRVAESLTPEDWARTKDMDGWKNNEVLAHVASVGGMVAPMVQGMANAPEGANAGASIDIDQLNAAMVGQRNDKSVADLAEEVRSSYTTAIEFVRTAPDDLLTKKADDVHQGPRQAPGWPPAALARRRSRAGKAGLSRRSDRRQG